jgi:hypothetical protein
METQSTNSTAPILNIAWAHYADLDASSKRGTRAHYNIRRWIALLGVFATLFAILSQLFPRGESAIGWVVRVLLIVTPLLASAIAYIAVRKFSGGSWLIKRAGSEEILKEIYFYRTILQKDKSRRAYLEKRLREIQKQVYTSLGGEFSFEGYSGALPPNYTPGDAASDPGFNDLTGEQYFQYRLENQLAWHNNKINQYERERDRLQWLIVGFGILGALLAAFDESTIWVALTASVTAAYVGWQELRNLDAIVKNYSKVVMELKILYNHWIILEPEERTTPEFYKMVRGCEEVLWAQNTEYIKSQQEALKDSDLEEEAGLISRVIRDSVESARRAQAGMRNALAEATRETLTEAEATLVEEFKETLGRLAEEASSELVQQELEAMQKAVTESAQALMARVSPLTSSLAEIAKEYAHVEIGRDTSKDELNAILARFPKSSEVRG